MISGTYAVVAYLNGPLADFVHGLRIRLWPAEAHIRPHLTLLAPRLLESPPDKLHSALKRICYNVRPVKVSLAGVESFVPASSTVYLGVHEGAADVCDLHERLNQYGFRADELWSFVPHVTLARLADDAAATKALHEAEHEWRSYQGARAFVIDRLTVVREVAPDMWADLVTVSLPSAELSSTDASPV
jgi:2'-5' RNA ligase